MSAGSAGSKMSTRGRQIAQVMQAYGKALETLKYHGDKAMVAQAQHEMGHIYAYFTEWGDANTLWNDCLDTLTGQYKAIRHLHKVIMADPVETLKSYTLYGCLLCGVVLTKIGKFTITSNLNLRLQCCLAASTMFSALFTCSMNHPQRLYDFGEYVPVEIWEGVNIFADPYKCSVLDLLEGLHFASSYLMANERFLEALPV